MAHKITNLFYQVSSTEDITFTISGPDDPHVFLDNRTLQVTSGVPFTITPQMLSGLGAAHFLSCILRFPEGAGKYDFTVTDRGGTISQFPIRGPNQEDFTEVQVTIKVA